MTRQNVYLTGHLYNLLSSEYVPHDHAGNFSYSYPKDVFTDRQLNFLRQFINKPVKLILKDPQEIPYYEVPLVTETDDRLIINADLKRFIFQFISNSLSKSFNTLLDIMTDPQLDTASRLGFAIDNSKPDVFNIYNYDRVMSYFNIRIEQFEAVEEFLQVYNLMQYDGHKHIIYTQQLRDIATDENFNIQPNFLKFEE